MASRKLLLGLGIHGLHLGLFCCFGLGLGYAMVHEVNLACDKLQTIDVNKIHVNNSAHCDDRIIDWSSMIERKQFYQ